MSMVEAPSISTTALGEYTVKRVLGKKTHKILMSKKRKLIGVSREGERESGNSGITKAKAEKI